MKKREMKSNIDFALVTALNGMDLIDDNSALPFEMRHEVCPRPTVAEKEIMNRYNKKEMREADRERLALRSAGALAMRYERSINTSRHWP